MNKRTTHISSNPGERIRYKARNGFGNDFLPDSEDSALFEAIGDYMKGRLDIEDVKNDPAILYTRETVAGMISDYNRNLPGNKENEDFIREVFADEVANAGIAEEISFIRQEIDDHNLNEITADWVKEWHQKKQAAGTADTRTTEISEFVTGALSSKAAEPVKTLHEDRGKHSIFIRYATLSAAALIGAFLLLRSLLPSSDPDKLFSSYYKPFAAISTATRAINGIEPNTYSSAIENYKRGNFQEASLQFGMVAEEKPDAIPPKFFQGLSELAMRNYAQAIRLLSGVAEVPGEYGKEATWYLGLTYLRTADKQRAVECFESLAKSGGFYRDRSEKILRRFK